MKKSSVLSGVIGLCALVLVAGCATMGGMSPEEAVGAQVGAFKAGLLEQDIDALMACFSENFEHYEWGDKEGAKDFLGQAIDMGYVEGIEVFLDDMEVKVEGETGTAYPIELSGSFGSVTIELTFTQEADGWLITGLDATGL